MSKKSSKSVLGYVKLTVEAQKASPTAAIGSVLGQKGVNIMEFCKAFNDKTKSIESGTPIPAILEVYKDKSFSLTIKTPPVSYYLKKAAAIKKGSSAPVRDDYVATISIEKCKIIAKEKMQDLNAYDVEHAVSMVVGSAKSMGIKIDLGY